MIRFFKNPLHCNAKCGLFFSLLLTGLLVAGCRSCSDNKPDLDVDVKDIPVKVQILRFEKDLFGISPDQLQKKLPDLKKKYGAILDIFAQAINIESPSDSMFIFSLSKFVNDPDMKTVAAEVMKKYNNVSALDSSLTQALKHFSYYYPGKKVPRVFTCMSGFNYFIIPADSILGISLEMYMGRDFRYYPMLGMPAYQIRNMTEDYIVPDFVKTMAFSMYPEKPEDLLGYMIYHGKVLYFLDALMPEANDTLKIGYTAKNMEYCEKNEKNIWKYFISNKLFYTKDLTEISKHVGDAPFTIPLGKLSAPRVGVWVGWQIVRTYMKNNSTITLPQLMQQKNAQLILSKSKYKP